MRPALLIALLSALAFPAAAQPASPPVPPATDPDVIGSLLDPNYHPSKEEQEEPDVAAQPRANVDVEPSQAPQAGVAARIPFARPPRSQLDRPVRIDETGKTPDRPPNDRDIAYDSRIRSSFASAEGFQGPLEGGWTLTADGQDLYALQLVDRRDRLEGAWRDLRRKGGLGDSGLVDTIQRQGADLALRFTRETGGAQVTAVLHPTADGRWTGDLKEGDLRRPAVLRRTGP